MQKSLPRFFKQLFIIVFSFPSFLAAQESIGLLSDNYLPVNQRKLNPSFMVDQKPWLSVNVVALHGYLRNNFAYLEDSRLNLFKDEPTVIFQTPSKFGKAFVTGELMGPSATLVIKHQAFGFHTAVRSYANMNRIPSVLGEIIADEGVENVEDGLYSITNGRLKTMSWFETGLSYGRNIYRRNDVMIDGGISLKRLIGIHQASLTIRDGNAEVLNGEATFRNLDAKYSYSDPSFGAGAGWGITIGGTYKKMNDYTDSYTPHSPSGGCNWLGYKYKISASLIDLGYIRFKEQARTANLPDTANIDALEDIDEEVLGIEEDQFTAALPTALSIQLDYHIHENFYVNTFAVQRVSLQNSFGVERSNLLTVNPRYESSWLTVSLPLSLANYTTPQLGLYFRFGPLAIGTDHLSPFIIKHDVKAGSIYASISLSLKAPACRNEKSPKFGKWFCPVW